MKLEVCDRVKIKPNATYIDYDGNEVFLSTAGQYGEIEFVGDCSWKFHMV